MRQLHNSYFGMRHGESLANVQGLIVSYPENGIKDEYGLSDKGKLQVEVAASNSELSPDTIIYSSDFSRAHQTAEIVRRSIGIDKIVLTKLLRERYFGDWEKTSNGNYKKVWEIDRITASTHEHNVEPLDHVWARISQLIEAIERTYRNRDILLVSHGDPLQILQTGLSGASLTKHRELSDFKTAEIRRLV